MAQGFCAGMNSCKNPQNLTTLDKLSLYNVSDFVKATQKDKKPRRSVLSSFNNTFISMLCFVYKEFKTSVDDD